MPKITTFLLAVLLAGCAQPAPQVKLLTDASCRLPAVTWSPDDTSQTVTEVRRQAAARRSLCKK